MTGVQTCALPISLRLRFTEELGAIDSQDALENARIGFLGKKGAIADLMQGLRDVPKEDKKTVGQMINDLKNEIESAISAKSEALKAEAIENAVKNAKHYNPTLPRRRKKGSFHPITLVEKDLEAIFDSMGFTVEDYDEIVDDYHCFESLNIPKYHPARDMQDTYYLENGQLLKTQTSAAQNAIMKKYGAPLRAIFPGRCFRNESTDACHENTFFQM